ncbi:MAG: DNA polymerase [Chloroflexi bacterium]|nr:DNA polymerase [Chloroflexota bacterium]
MFGESFLWVEKYRPKTINECILPDRLKTIFQQISSEGRIPNMILSGGPGMGKTTVAKALCNEVGCDFLMINGSEESGIDVLRTKIRGYASTVSFDGKRKVVILDEADYLNPQSTQPALRSFIEEFEKHCSFIMTCNYINRIIEPLHSRCQTIDFRINKEEKLNVGSNFGKRLYTILDQEKVDYDKKVVAEVLMKHFPDYRRVLNELQKYSKYGNIDSGILSQVSDIDLSELMNHMKDKKFNEVRKWVVNNLDNDPQKIYRKIYDVAEKYVQTTSIPQLVLILADSQYKSAFAADHELNLVACLVEIMVECQFN